MHGEQCRKSNMGNSHGKLAADIKYHGRDKPAEQDEETSVAFYCSCPNLVLASMHVRLCLTDRQTRVPAHHIPACRTIQIHKTLQHEQESKYLKRRNGSNKDGKNDGRSTQSAAQDNTEKKQSRRGVCEMSMCLIGIRSCGWAALRFAWGVLLLVLHHTCYYILNR